MLVNGEHTTSLRTDPHARTVTILDQRDLPHRITWEPLPTAAAVITAIRDMHLRGAPLIGAAGAYGYYFAIKESQSVAELATKEQALRAARPTAINLNWAIDRMVAATADLADFAAKADAAWLEAEAIVAEDIANCRKIGEHGLPLLAEIHARTKKPVNILMHCNPGWLACLDWGTATAPIYLAHQEGIPVHVWVDETRPRNQGAKLTAFEFHQQGVPYSVITDNSGGHLMQHGQVDIVLVGTDRTSLNGDVCNKIGTYLKALAAYDNQVPFYVGLPSSTIDPKIENAFAEIPIEERDPEEVTFMDGKAGDDLTRVQITYDAQRAVNHGFDITPARLVTGLITERGIAKPNRDSILKLFPELSP